MGPSHVPMGIKPALKGRSTNMKSGEKERKPRERVQRIWEIKRKEREEGHIKFFILLTPSVK